MLALLENTEKCFISLKKEILNWETGQFINAQLHRAREWFVYLCSGVQRLSSISITKGTITPNFFSSSKKLENVLVQTSACKRATRSQARIPAQEKIDVFSLYLKISTQITNVNTKIRGALQVNMTFGCGEIVKY